MAAWKLGPALAAGCTVVLKPAEQTPLSALRLGELILEAGFPDGVVNIVPGSARPPAPLAAHPDVDKVAFTGSTEVGKLIVQAAAGNLKKVSLELGGKSPNIVFADADLEVAIAGAAAAIFFNHGQCCCAGSRLFVGREDLRQGRRRRRRRQPRRSGRARHRSATPKWARWSREEQLRPRRAAISTRACHEGAKAVDGGAPARRQGLLRRADGAGRTRNRDMKVVREEIFGPVVARFRSRNRGRADRRPPTTPPTAWPRGSGRATSRKAHRIAGRLQAGTVWINCYNVFDAALPFGGYKQSGWGREMGHDALELYTETKAVCAGALIAQRAIQIDTTRFAGCRLNPIAGSSRLPAIHCSRRLPHNPQSSNVSGSDADVGTAGSRQSASPSIADINHSLNVVRFGLVKF